MNQSAAKRLQELLEWRRSYNNYQSMAISAQVTGRYDCPQPPALPDQFRLALGLRPGYRPLDKDLDSLEQTLRQEVAREPVAGPSDSSKTRMSKRSKSQEKQYGVIFGALQAGLKGAAYCRHLDDGSVRLPLEWTDRGCPETYTAAYRIRGPWRKKIQDQKHRYKIKYDKTAKDERERLIQNATRPTRS